MTSFDERKKEQEAKFKHEQELAFKVTVRRNKLLGLWAAELMGKADDAAEAYGKEVVVADFEKPGDQDVVDKVLGDLVAAGVEMDEYRLRKKMERLTEVAREQVMAE
ncbi:MAG: DUF1476 domain-containing protein [Alphaproteobacteria bacterium]